MPAINCPHCKGVFNITPDVEGQPIACSHCGGQFVAPAPLISSPTDHPAPLAPIISVDESAPPQVASKSNRAKQFGASVAAKTKAAAQVAAKYAERTKIMKHELPSAYGALGKEVYTAGTHREDLPGLFQNIDEIQATIKSLKEGTSIEDEQTFSDKAKATANKAMDSATAKALSVKVNGVFRQLGQSAYEQLGEESGPPELIEAISTCLTRIETLDAEIQELETKHGSGIFTPKRIAIVGTGVAAAMIFLIMGFLVGQEDSPPKQGPVAGSGPPVTIRLPPNGQPPVVNVPDISGLLGDIDNVVNELDKISSGTGTNPEGGGDDPSKGREPPQPSIGGDKRKKPRSKPKSPTSNADNSNLVDKADFLANRDKYAYKTIKLTGLHFASDVDLRRWKDISIEKGLVLGDHYRAIFEDAEFDLKVPVLIPLDMDVSAVGRSDDTTLTFICLTSEYPAHILISMQSALSLTEQLEVDTVNKGDFKDNHDNYVGETITFTQMYLQADRSLRQYREWSRSRGTFDKYDYFPVFFLHTNPKMKLCLEVPWNMKLPDVTPTDPVTISFLCGKNKWGSKEKLVSIKRHGSSTIYAAPIASVEPPEEQERKPVDYRSVSVDSVTEDFLPFAPGLILVYQQINRFGPAGSMKTFKGEEHKTDGVIRKRTHKDVKFFAKGQSAKLDIGAGETIAHYRINDGFVEIGDEFIADANTILWEKKLKIGAKAGDLWTDNIGGVQTEYSILFLGEYKNHAVAAVVSSSTTGQLTTHATTWYIKGLGCVKIFARSGAGEWERVLIVPKLPFSLDEMTLQNVGVGPQNAPSDPKADNIYDERLWTWTNGTSIRATFLSFDMLIGEVSFETSAGRVSSFHIGALHPDDQTYVLSLEAAKFRTWTNGDKQIRARLVKFEDSVVFLINSDEKSVELPIDDLSDEDQVYVKRREELIEASQLTTLFRTWKGKDNIQLEDEARFVTLDKQNWVHLMARGGKTIKKRFSAFSYKDRGYIRKQMSRRMKAKQEKEFRTWTTADGKLLAEARFIKLEDNIVYLKKRGTVKKIEVPLEKLSEEDQTFVKEKIATTE